MFHTSALVVRRLVRTEARRQKTFGLVSCHPFINRKVVAACCDDCPTPFLIEEGVGLDLNDPLQSQSMLRRGGYKLGAYTFT